MFPDPTVCWRPYTSMMDGLKNPPFVFDQGLWKRRLHRVVLEAAPGPRAYGVQIECEVYAGFDEMIYSLANHGDESAGYNEDAYIKEATASALISAFKAAHPFGRTPRHFLFAGGDLCFETLGFSEPTIHRIEFIEEVYEWGPDRSN